MAEAQEIPAGTYDLKLGETFQDRGTRSVYHTLRLRHYTSSNSQSPQYTEAQNLHKERSVLQPMKETIEKEKRIGHIKHLGSMANEKVSEVDFKPKSLASEAETYIAFGANGDVQVAVPGENDTLTVYKGSQKPVKAEKECLLFFDHNSGELRLEKLTSNMSVKKTRDVDEATATSLRMGIQRLRKKLRCHSERTDDSEAMDDSKSSSGSVSSSSVSDDSDSDSEESVADKPEATTGEAVHPSCTTSDEEVNDSVSGDDDDDLQDELEQHLNSDSMPTIGNTTQMQVSDKSSSYHASSKPPYSSSAHHNNHHTSKMLLVDDLQLSESSDDD